jgi:hypothetical protein
MGIRNLPGTPVTQHRDLLLFGMMHTDEASVRGMVLASRLRFAAFMVSAQGRTSVICVESSKGFCGSCAADFHLQYLPST